jgi:crossover junction endodeoxyribonuclease RusA
VEGRGVIVLTLPYPISANRYWQSFVPPGAKRALVHLSTEAKAFKKDVAWIARAAGIRQPLAGRIAVEIDLYPHRPADWRKRVERDPLTWDDTVQCLDLGNCEKVLSDALNGIAYVDDKQTRRLTLQRMEPDGEARVVVRISEIPLASPQAALPLPPVVKSAPADNEEFFA